VSSDRTEEAHLHLTGLAPGDIKIPFLLPALSMPATPQKTLSPAELAKLEHAFATEPGSQAYKPLAEAYLGMGRFMEAMVVCKKGVKAHPNIPDARLLLARVYAEQGKDKKALEELAGALQIAPSDKNVLRMTGALQMKAGERDAGRSNLLKAYEADPADAETLALFQQHQIPIPRAEPPPPPPAPQQEDPTDRNEVPAPPVLRPEPKSGARRPPAQPPAGGPPMLAEQPVSMGGEGAPQLAREPISAVRRATPASTAAVPAAGMPNGAVARGQAPARPPPQRAPSMSRPAAPPPRALAPPPPDVDLGGDDEDEDDDVSPRRRRPSPQESRKRTRTVFIVLALALPAALGGYAAYGRWAAINAREIKKHLAEATEQLKHDSYASYKKACEAAAAALERDPNSTAAHGYLAYAWAIRWGEHGGGDAARKQAEEHLEAAKSGGEISSHLYAAEALIQTFAGKGAQALAELEKRVRDFDAEGRRSSLMYLTLGLIQMNAGDLEHAKDSLETAQTLSPDDPRTYAALGRLSTRRGEDNNAWKQYDFALRYEKDHHESLLGKALLMLDQPSPNFQLAAQMLKKLLTGDPPPSPRQLATAQLGQALLISRVSRVMPDLRPEVQKQLSEATSVPIEPERARQEMLKAEKDGIDMARLDPELHLIRGRRLRGDGQLDQAIDAIREAIKADPSRAHFHVELAKALMEKQGGEREAVTALLTAVKTMGESPKLLVMLGDAYRKQGKAEDALQQYQRAVSDPKAKNPDARLSMGVLYRERRDHARAIEQLEKAAQEFVGQSYRVAAVYTELGRVHEDKGDRAKADEIYLKALTADPEYPDAYFFYGRYLSEDRRSQIKARTTLQEYLKKDPRGPYAEEARRILQ
jgi:tetratricopeptide (TPR) repeat protein